MKNKYLLLLFSFIFLFIPDVNAETTFDYLSDLTQIKRGDIYYFSSTGPNILDTDLQTYYDTTSPSIDSSTDQITGLYTGDTTKIGSFGTGIRAEVDDLLQPNYLYAYSIYFCSDASLFNNVNWDFTYGYGYGPEGLDDFAYYSKWFNSVSKFQGQITYNYCYVAKTIFSIKNIVSPYINFYMTTATGSVINTKLYFVGHNLTSLGLYDGYIKEVVNEAVDTSGFATAESVSQVQESVNEVKEKITEVNDTLNDDDVSESTDSANSFFSGFSTDTFGLTSVITSPLNLISNIASATCSPLPLEVPFVNKTLNLPCMSSIYQRHFGDFLQVYQTITFGIVAYWVCVNLFNLVKDFKNPEHDEIEVMDL